ncbi:NAD(P)-dependent oxidoreductase [Ensifer sp. 4252]|uniref:NAD(P)-dependent oxidoreductase n=1 Tax=Ensifer sp. 4252 TaxID=3373915 RepID=UPI003D256CFA
MHGLATPDRSLGMGPVRRVAVPAVSFGQHAGLVAHLRTLYPDARVNTEGVTVYRSEEDTIAYLADCEAAIVSFEPINDRVLSALPALRVVSKLGVGLDKIEPAAMKRHGVRIGWTPGINKRSVAELAFCMALMALRHVGACNLAMRAGERPLQRIGRQLSGRVVGVHGVGEIGQEFIRLLKPFGCEILGNDIRDRSAFYDEHGVRAVSFDELLERSEVLSIHLQVTDKTRWLYTAEVLDRLRPDCVLINTARGRIIDEAALRDRLADGRIAAAGIDAFAVEPPEDDVLLGLPNFIATPHIGAGSEEARWTMGMTAIQGFADNFIPEPGVFPFEDR